MTMPLTDFQFEIDDVAFGLGCPVFVEENGFDPGQASWRSTTKDAPRRGGRRFGRDLPSAPTWAWDLATDESDPDGALATLAQLRRAWRAYGIRAGYTGEVIPLRYTIGGRTRIVYGRPNNWAAAPDNRILGGLVPITADFLCADDLTYSDEEKATVIQTAPASTSGFTVPLTTPLTVVGAPPPRAGSIVVESDEPTAALVTFYGPSSGSATGYRLTVDEGAWEVGFDGSIFALDEVAVDPRPWATTALYKDGRSAAGGLSRATLMEKMVLAPGSHTLRFTALDPTGTAAVKVAWRGASSSL